VDGMGEEVLGVEETGSKLGHLHLFGGSFILLIIVIM